MARWSYPQVEGVLYGLAGQPEARVGAPRLRASPAPHEYGPRGPFPETVRRLDVAIAVRGLSPDDRSAIVTHYIRGARVPKSARRTAVKRLVVLLGSLDT